MSKFNESRLDYQHVPDIGLTKDEYSKTVIGLNKLLRVPENPVTGGTNIEDLIGDVLPIVESQERFVGHRFSRRSMIFKTTVFLGSVGAMVTGAANIDKALNVLDTVQNWDSARLERAQLDRERSAAELA